MLPVPKLLSVLVCKFCITTNASKIIRGEFTFVQKLYSTSGSAYSPASSTVKDHFLRHIRYPKLYKGHLKTMKIDSEHYKKLFTPELLTLSKLFTQNGFEIRMAGGAVRDLLMDKMPVDIDFATTATPDEMKEMFERESIRMINTRGEKHGTITARINDKENFEITTLRIDVSTDGRHAEVEFTKNWELDAGRRDLTINSMYLDLDGTVHDYFNGMDDLKNLAIRFVGDPKDRIQEDYLRILRYFRFYGRIVPLGIDTHEASTLQAISENVDGLKQISGERIWSELRKILMGNHAVELLLTMLEVGIGPYIGLPNKSDIENYKMLMDRLKSLNLEVNPVTSLCALLREEYDGRALHARLKLSSFERDLCLFVIQHRERRDGDDKLKYYQTMVLMNNKIPPQIQRNYFEEVLKYNGEIELLKQLQEWKEPRFPINGHMILSQQVKPKAIGFIVEGLRKRWIDSDFTLSQEELLKMVSELKDLSMKPK